MDISNGIAWRSAAQLSLAYLMITLGTESGGTNLLGGTVFFHRLAHTFTFILAKLSHLFGNGGSEAVATPLAVGGSIFTVFAFTTVTALVIPSLMLFLTVVVVVVVTVTVLFHTTTTTIDFHIVMLVMTFIVMMIRRRSVGNGCGCHFWINVDGITHVSICVSIYLVLYVTLRYGIFGRSRSETTEK
jgi:hypothetical protein